MLIYSALNRSCCAAIGLCWSWTYSPVGGELLVTPTKIEIAGSRVGPHALRATAVTNALEHDADIARVQERLGHAHIATTRIYDRPYMRPENSPTFRVEC